MSKETSIQLFESKKVRSVWDAEAEKWYISIIDVIEVLTESIDPAAYWRKLKQRLKEEGNGSRSRVFLSDFHISFMLNNLRKPQAIIFSQKTHKNECRK
ncbi:MAG: hypothetical protein FWH27_19250 [Planctomycetaceae bacterium]|nr:hypothetical protein [Planctomycetaceae bacterium]